MSVQTAGSVSGEHMTGITRQEIPGREVLGTKDTIMQAEGGEEKKKLDQRKENKSWLTLQFVFMCICMPGCVCVSVRECYHLSLGVSMYVYVWRELQKE